MEVWAVKGVEVVVWAGAEVEAGVVDRVGGEAR